MCLERCKTTSIRTDKECYKVLLKNPYDGELRSPLRSGMVWAIGETAKINADEPDFIANCSGLNQFGEVSIEINGNAFHTLRRKRDAINYAKLLASHRPGTKFEIVVVKCTIPKDTKYIYEGKVQYRFFQYYDGYASQSLRVDEIVGGPYNI